MRPSLLLACLALMCGTAPAHAFQHPPSVQSKAVNHPYLAKKGIDLQVRSVGCRTQWTDSGESLDTPDPGQVEFRLTSQTGRRTLATDPCAYPAARTVRGHGWKARSGMDMGRWPTLRVTVGLRHTHTYRLRYAVLVARQLIETGRLRIVAIRHPEHRIWEGTDDFINVCINHGHTLYSEGGQLYCYFPPWTEVRATATPSK